MRQFIFPVAIIVAVALTIWAEGCTLHENPIGHRIDQPPVLIVTPTKPDDDGGSK